MRFTLARWLVAKNVDNRTLNHKRLYSSTFILIIGLHWATDQGRLRKVFGKFGDIKSEHLWVPEHSASHKWAAIEYATFDEALEATSEMNGHEVDGRLLRVSIRDPPGKDKKLILPKTEAEQKT
ncbi:unnamed protein product [Albugo candida]|uniref:RRM domain-containing protein n=1 Tax=Albugo candida TaxID=65357 RepID=A0A024GMC1_9STRA|nr:unnamed protein product [Albugo candida]|eukprot:CCI48026.1 unnamed protein product [Albugo candida]